MLYFLICVLFFIIDKNVKNSCIEKSALIMDYIENPISLKNIKAVYLSNTNL